MDARTYRPIHYPASRKIVLVAVMRSGDLLLLSTSTNLLYLLRNGHYQDIPILFGSVTSGVNFEQFVELVSNQILYAPTSLVSQHAVPDNEVHNVLCASEVNGLRPVVSVGGPSLSEENKLAYSGNLVDPTWMFICVDGNCSSKCVFCYTEWIRNKPGLSTTAIRTAIEHAVSISSLKAVVFSGGEPTLRKDLPELIAHAATHGFMDIGVHTNGHRLANEKYLEELCNAGLTGVLLSLHGATRATHDSMAGIKGSFDKAVRALTLLHESMVRTTVNFVVCTANCPELPAFAKLVKSISPNARIRLSFPIIEGEAYRNSKSILPSFPDFIQSIVLTLSEDPQLKPRIEVVNVPACISSQLQTDPEYLVSQRRSFMEVSPFYKNRIERGEQLVKLQKCRTCSWVDDCGGVQIPYLTRFVDAHDHIVPQESKMTD